MLSKQQRDDLWMFVETTVLCTWMMKWLRFKTSECVFATSLDLETEGHKEACFENLLLLTL